MKGLLQSNKRFLVLILTLLMVLVWTPEIRGTNTYQHVFSVSASEQVYFSPGNLQYQASTNTWRFALDPWDYIGYDNENISQSYDGWIDLFGWGTSGWDCGNVFFHPWDNEYSWNIHTCYGPPGDTDMTGSYSNSDWGVYNPISNGGNAVNLWRTLTGSEWQYVLYDRATVSGIRFAKAKVNDVNGFVLVPDDWTAGTYSLNNTNMADANFICNTISCYQWSVLEQAGAVFLPAAGIRVGNIVDEVDSYGFYWSASHVYNNGAWFLHFGNSNLNMAVENGGDRCYGRSVRLVCVLENYSSVINATPNPTEGGTVSGAGSYGIWSTCTLTASANEGYTFINWTENGEVVSTDAIYSFLVYRNRKLEANFRHEEVNINNGALSGCFSVSDNQQVHFSQGNLQYIGSLSTPYWKFAEHQWDCINYSEQGNTQQTMNRDLFGWGTSGYNHGGICYQPWSTSINDGDYYAFGSVTGNLYDYPCQADWGYNAISNGGATEDRGWRTPKKEEWEYLFYTRATSSGIRFAMAQVNEVNGVILLPDDWDASYYDLSGTNDSNVSFNSNVITSSQWVALESHGAVFLPLVGVRSGTIVNNSLGEYWSASSYNGSRAFAIKFGVMPLSTISYFECRSNGLSVRLIRCSENTSFGVNAVSNPLNGGEVTDGGIYLMDTECTFTAMANPGYVFVNWTEDGTIVSTDAEYTFLVTKGRSLVANFRREEVVIENGALCGLFSVNGSKQVQFSQGNLQYIGSSVTPYWKFAEHQWDYFGDNGQGNTSSKVNRDLFGWGTSGYKHGATCYQPWSYSTYNGDYYAYGNFTRNLHDYPYQADWGYNPIVNGGNVENMGWHTLSYEEWNYLFNTRITPSGIRYAMGQVNGVNGVILLPDDWNASYYNLNQTNTASSFDSNVITTSQWTVLEQHGAVLLPAAGHRAGTTVSADGSDGNYWLSSCVSNACCLYLLDGDIGVEYDDRYFGHSVRLVRYAGNTSFDINVTPSPSEYGMVSGGGVFVLGSECTLTATPNEGFAFSKWTDNGVFVSAEATYSFTVMKNRSLVAHFTMGALDGLFTVGENQQVCFSQGNLQYQASTNTWRFAENQWDYVGNDVYGTVYENGVKCDNSLISSTYRGWIDLFGWGTSGHNHGAVCYQPWCTNENNGEYVAYDKWQANLFEQTGQADWGSNAISNGGNQTNQWRILNRDEWVYVFDTRTTPSGIRWTKGNVNGVNGVILLPDDWDVTYYTLNDANGGYYNSNVVSSEDWANIFETHGAVFLPVAAQRLGTWVRPEGSYNYDFGVYWSSSWCNDDNAWSVYFHPDGINVYDSWQRFVGRSVRLVCPAQANTTYTIGAVSNPEGSGTFTGTGTYNYYDQVTLTANANEGYTFAYWKENGNDFTTENPISFVALFNRSFEACFWENSTYPLHYNFNEDNHTATVIGHWDGKNASGALVIPETVAHNGETYTVTAIGEWAFSECSGLTSIVIPNTVTYLENHAFYGCSGITGAVVVPNSISSINDGVFEYCSGITSVSYGTNVTSIGNYAFRGCSSLLSFDIHNSVTSIGEYAFSECPFTSIVFPNSINYIGNWAFRYCNGLTEVFIPSSVTSIGVNPFTECLNLAQITVAPGNAYYDSRDSCNAIVNTSTNCLISGSLNAFIPSTVTSLGQDAFYIPSLTSMTVYAETPPIWNTCSFCGVDSSIPIYVPCGSQEAYQNAEGWNEFWNSYGECLCEISLTANPVESGDVSGGGMMITGGNVTVTAIDNENYVFVNWTENGEVVSTEAEYTFMVTGDRNLVANFIPKYYIITTLSNPVEGGDVSGAGSYDNGSTCTLTATPNDGYSFVNWTENGEVVSTDAEYTFTVTCQRNLVANFRGSDVNIVRGALCGQFSVDADRQIQFSQGNLQYIGSSATPYWKFAEHQWDYFGDNGQGSDSPTANRDLFGWGTSGYNHGAVSYQPWSTSTNDGNYYAYGNAAANLYDQTGQADWGYNAISNGGDEENRGWRTLTYEEWQYLFNTRITPSGVRYAMARVNGVNGMILLPDDWNVTYYNLNQTNTAASFESNIVTPSQWTVLEQHGAVFLPSAGIREENVTEDLDTAGYYWLSSCASSPYYIYIFSGIVDIGSDNRYFGQSVRLVRNFVNVTFDIDVNANPVEGGTVRGGGSYLLDSDCTVTATANFGYVFVDWTEDGEVVSTDAEYTFMVTGDRTLEANFEKAPVEMTFALVDGWNWFSTNIEITLNDLKAALVAALPGTEITIKSKDRSATYNGNTWRGTLSTLDVTRMYMIKTSASCEIVLTGMSIDPTERPLAIVFGVNWIGFPMNENMSLTDAFAGFAANGDMVKSKNISSSYNGTRWRGTLNTLLPGQGYIYKSVVSGARVFTFPVSGKCD